MLQGVRALVGFAVHATDGAIGTVKDVYFDDHLWIIRYVVVETGPALKRRSVLLAPVALKPPQWQGHTLLVSLTREQVRKSPDINTDKPVSRQQETELSEYFGWPPLTGPSSPSINERVDLPEPVAEAGRVPAEKSKGDPNLRSANEVVGYHVQATDAQAGKVKDIIINDTKWVIRYLLIDAGHWIIPKLVLISPEWVDRISWEEKRVLLDLDRRGVRGSPPPESLSAPFRKWMEFFHRKSPGG